MNYLNYDVFREKDTVAIILRHAERYPVNDPLDPTKALLTEKGHNDAYALGKKLSFLKPAQFYASPVTRCRQTAEGIAKGINEPHGSSQLVSSLYNLGGAYILGDWGEVIRMISKYGISIYLRKWFDGEFPKDILMPLAEAAHLELDILKKQIENSEKAVNITHDWNIMILREYFFNLKHEDVGLPDFLDGMAAYPENGHLSLVYHEHSCHSL